MAMNNERRNWVVKSIVVASSLTMGIRIIKSPSSFPAELNALIFLSLRGRDELRRSFVILGNVPTKPSHS
eukprot:scaffold1318_cov362-Pavlova_lutheri.AAC.38